MKRKQRAIKEFNFSDYDFSDCVEITGDALYLINGGGTTTESKSNSGSSQGSGDNSSSGGGNEIDNSHEAVANAKPGDYFYRDDGTKQVVNAGDIAYEKNYLQNSGNNDKATQTPETTTATENETSQNTACGGSEHKGSDSIYTVHKGDTLSKIVYDHNQKYGTNLTVAEVAKKNGIKDPNKIFSGQQINLGLSQTRETQKPTTKRSETFTANNQIINKDNGIRTAPEPYEISGDSPNGENVSVGKQAATTINTADENVKNQSVTQEYFIYRNVYTPMENIGLNGGSYYRVTSFMKDDKLSLFASGKFIGENLVNSYMQAGSVDLVVDGQKVQTETFKHPSYDFIWSGDGQVLGDVSFNYDFSNAKNVYLDFNFSVFLNQDSQSCPIKYDTKREIIK